MTESNRPRPVPVPGPARPGSGGGPAPVPPRTRARALEPQTDDASPDDASQDDAGPFADLDQWPVAEHVAVFDAEHARLQRELGAIDQI